MAYKADFAVVLALLKVAIAMLNIEKKMVTNTGGRLHSKWLNSEIKENPFKLKSALKVAP